MRYLVIVNPAAGNGRKHKIESAVQVFRSAGHPVEIFWTGSRGDATAKARAAALSGEADAVIAAGGDGTVNEVARGLEGSKISLGVLPLGTANCLAREIGIPLRPVAAAKALLKCKPRRIHVGRTEDTLFLLWTGVGIDGQVVQQINVEAKKVLHHLEYVRQGFHTLLHYKPSPLRVTLDGKESTEACHVIIGNIRCYGGWFSVTPGAGLMNDELEVCLFRGNRSRDILRYSWGILWRKHMQYKDVTLCKAREIRIESDQPVPIQLDGDYLGTTPITVRRVPDAISLLMP